MRTIAVHVRFANRSELAHLDAAARALGGVRAGVEFRPCYGYTFLLEKPHSATYLFSDERLRSAFARGRTTE